jgi:hypothetical protein
VLSSHLFAYSPIRLSTFPSPQTWRRRLPPPEASTSSPGSTYSPRSTSSCSTRWVIATVVAMVTAVVMAMVMAMVIAMVIAMVVVVVMVTG